MDVIFLIALALSPGLAIVLYIYLKDVHEPEPLRPLLLGFFLGIVSFFVAYGFSILLNRFFRFDLHSPFELIFHALIVVGFVEEFSKFLFIRGVLFPNKNFNEPFDGIVYAVMVGMGFATTENIFYVLEGDGGTAILRMFSAVPAHALFAVLMGFLLGEAKIFPQRQFIYSISALGIAALFHGMYDYFLFISFIPGIWIGAAVSLLLAYLICRQAIRLHQEISPFR